MNEIQGDPGFKALIKKGTILGLVSGLITTFFDGFFMLVPNTYVPISYPILLLTFNTIFWMTIGGLSGFFMWIFARNRKGLRGKERFYWVFFFLLPFVVIYGLLGRLFVPLVSPPVDPRPTVFDYHLSFVWASLILLCLIVFKKRVIAVKPLAISFIPEVTAFCALFIFCSNIATTQTVYKCIAYLFFQDTQLSYKGYLAIPQRYLISVYAMGILLILGFFFLIFFRTNFLNKKQSRVIVLLCLIVFISLATLFTVDHNQFVRHNYPPITQKQIDGTKKIPLILLIVLDTVRADSLSVYNDRGITKTLETIASHSLVFENCIAPSSWTTPSHASLFTGLYPTEHGSIHDLNSNAAFRPLPLAEEFLSLAEIFRNNGYATGAVVSNYGALQKIFKINQGFQIYDAARNIGDIYRSHPFHPLVHLFCYLSNVFPKFLNPCRTADDITKESFRALTTLAPSPFFLFINYMDAHAPYRPPSPFDGYFLDALFPQLHRLWYYFLNSIGKIDKKSWNSYLRSQYDGEISYLDFHLNKLFTRLKKLNLYDPSLIIITADHGELFGEHGLNFHRTPMYEEVLKVPLLIKFPYSQRVGYEKGMISLTDLYPTILSICNLPVPDGISGESFGNSFSPIVSELHINYLGKHRALYNEGKKLMHYEKQKDPELYDLKKDPLEKTNLFKKLPVIAAAMNKKLNEWIKEHTPRYSPQDIKKTPLPKEVEEGLKALGYIE